ncbi:MAG: hypothetical protein K2Q01_10290, partial [Rickettsiales bacterium]|nr:hypothetical protein [Rickettsiales bacterium]
EQFYYGADAMHAMAMLSTGQGAFNKVMAVVFRSRGLSHLLYPILRAGRRVLLRLRHIPALENSL